MDIETICAISRKQPSATEGIKWGNDLCFMVGEKMFCVVMLEGPTKVSLKVLDEEFETLSTSDGIIPAPYAARNKWILVENINVFSKKKWEFYIAQSYSLVRSKLTKKVQSKLD